MMFDRIDEIASELGRKWRIPHFEKKYERREYRRRGEPAKNSKSPPPKPKKIIRDDTLRALKFHASRAVYAKQIVEGMATDKFGKSRINDALFSQKRVYVDFRKDVARNLDYLGFSDEIIAKALKKDRTTVIFYLGKVVKL